MKATIETTDLRNTFNSGSRLAPSLRVPVTPKNRALLRWLRAAELSAWETGRTCLVPDSRIDSATPENSIPINH